MADTIPDFSWLMGAPPPDPEIAAALAEREAAKWGHQTWDVVITDREMILQHLERSCGGGNPQPFLGTGDLGVVMGQGPSPKGLRYSTDTLAVLRDEGLVTSWKDGKVYVAGNNLSTTVKWYYGPPDEWGFEGPGVLNGEEV